jgi:glycosyl transferase, family 25
MEVEGKMGWPFFEHAYVINLDSRTDRWEKMQSQFTEMGIDGVERFSAISFDQLENDPPPPQFRNRSWALALRNGKSIATFEKKLFGAWACLRSHLEIIAHAKNEGWPWVLIMEDDCEFEPYAKPVMELASKQIAGHDWDMLYLGGKCKQKGFKKRLSPNLSSVNRLLQTHAYVVRSTIYEKILREAPLAGMPIDVYYSEILLPTIKALLIEPQVAYQRLHETSNISLANKGQKFKLRDVANVLKRRIACIRYGR